VAVRFRNSMFSSDPTWVLGLRTQTFFNLSLSLTVSSIAHQHWWGARAKQSWTAARPFLGVIKTRMAIVYLQQNEKERKPRVQNVVYYESIKRELKRRLIYVWVSLRWKIKTKTEESTRLADTGLVVVELEHLKIKTRLIDEKFASVRGDCEI
jgi:hypothetical protein